jgi:hypothetical protein
MFGKYLPPRAMQNNEASRQPASASIQERGDANRALGKVARN